MNKGLAALCITMLLAGCSGGDGKTLQGYAEGEYVRVAAPFAGSLMALKVKRGEAVKAGDPLFVLEQENERAARQGAEERLKQANGALATVRAQRDQAAAALRLSEVSYRRSVELAAKKFISKQQLDDARTALERDRAGLASMEAQIAAAEAEARAAKATLDQAQWALGQKTVAAPVTGRVDDTLYVTGEWVPAGNPIVSLLPPENIKVRFFVPEPRLGAVKTGQAVELRCDGCGAPIPATVSYIASQPEYTPPVIYSQENRAKLVYLVEARPAPEQAVRLHPGQPVDVRF